MARVGMPITDNFSEIEVNAHEQASEIQQCPYCGAEVSFTAIQQSAPGKGANCCPSCKQYIKPGSLIY